MVLPKEKGLEREAASWFTQMYPRNASTRLAHRSSCRYHTGVRAARVVDLTIMHEIDSMQDSCNVLSSRPVSCADSPR